MRHILLSTLLFLSFPIMASQNVVKMEMDGDQFSIGEPIPVRLLVDQPEGQHISWPDLNTLDAGLEVVADDTITEGQFIRRELLFMRFDTGSFFFPPIPLELVQGADTFIYETAGRPYNVTPFPADTTQDIRPIKDIQKVRYRKQPIALFGFLALCLFGLILWLIYRKLSQKPMTEVPEVRRPKPVKPIEEHALERLKALEEKKLW